MCVLVNMTSKPSEEAKMSLGEDRVRIRFNPSDDSKVAEIKRKAAELIDMINDMSRDNADPEFRRCCAEAMTCFETGQMYGVKAATFGT
jgi:hypothetical protein